MAASGAMWDDTTVKLLVSTYIAQGDLNKVRVRILSSCLRVHVWVWV